MGAEQARIVPWEEGSRSALITTAPAMTLLSSEFVVHCVEVMAARGFEEVRTGALSPLEEVAFLQAGFEVRSELALLAMSLESAAVAPVSAGRFEDYKSRRIDELVDVDRAAFGESFGFGLRALQEAIVATPFASVRVALADAGRLGGYAVFGRSALHGYVQRLAVTPSAQRRGAGRGLLGDGLGWMRRSGVAQVFVNTERSNEAALALYRSAGFEEQRTTLSTLSVSLR
jgi:ribosomal protein S18 acetylase RimI-like enzyme